MPVVSRPRSWLKGLICLMFLLCLSPECLILLLGSPISICVMVYPCTGLHRVLLILSNQDWVYTQCIIYLILFCKFCRLITIVVIDFNPCRVGMYVILYSNSNAPSAPGIELKVLTLCSCQCFSSLSLLSSYLVLFEVLILLCGSLLVKHVDYHEHLS